MQLIRPTFILVIVSCLIGIPFGIYFGSAWLSQYPNRIDFSPWFFCLAFVFISVIVLAAILYHCIKLTRINPIEVLRKNDL
jgi:putative ABC transport system permease protein